MFPTMYCLVLLGFQQMLHIIDLIERWTIFTEFFLYNWRRLWEKSSSERSTISKHHVKVTIGIKTSSAPGAQKKVLHNKHE